MLRGTRERTIRRERAYRHCVAGAKSQTHKTRRRAPPDIGTREMPMRKYVDLLFAYNAIAAQPRIGIMTKNGAILISNRGIVFLSTPK